MRMPKPFRRAVPVPDGVLAAAALRQGERVLAGTQADDAWLLGTHQALHVVRDGADSPIPWERIERADWARDEERLTVTEVGEFGRVRPEHEFSVEDPGLLLELVRERVTASIVLQRRVSVGGKQGLTLIGRRSPVGDGAVAWAYAFDPGVDPEDPEVMRVAEAALRQAESDLGL